MSLLLEMFLDFLDSSDGQRFLESIPKQSSQPIKHVLIDDYEDTSPLKAEICFRLVEKLEAPNLTVVGDADQALYRFTGRMPETFIRFHSRASQRFDEPVNTVHLNHNYRSTPDIISWCNRYIREYPEMQEDGVRIQDKRPMVVARPNTGSRSDVYGLRADTAPRSAERATTLIESFRERGIIDEYSEVAFLFRTTTGGAIKQYQEKLEEHGIPVDTEWEGPRTDIGQNGVRFMTIHASKENEFPVVFADTGCKGPLTNGTYWLEEQLEPYADFTLHTDAETRAETDRVREYYVAYTRAQRKLILLDITEASEVPLGYDENGQPIAENLPSDEEILTFTPEGVTGVGDEFLH